MEDGWIPRHKPNGVYCSPRCGGQCKLEHYEHAFVAADALAARMGEGWTPNVWENLGWHYSVSKGVAAIHPIQNWREPFPWPVERYTCYFNTARQSVATADTPEDALGFAVQDVQTINQRISADLEELLS